jgi:hypothetical protein
MLIIRHRSLVHVCILHNTQTSSVSYVYARISKCEYYPEITERRKEMEERALNNIRNL